MDEQVPVPVTSYHSEDWYDTVRKQRSLVLILVFKLPMVGQSFTRVIQRISS